MMAATINVSRPDRIEGMETLHRSPAVEVERGRGRFIDRNSACISFRIRTDGFVPATFGSLDLAVLGHANRAPIERSLHARELDLSWSACSTSPSENRREVMAISAWVPPSAWMTSRVIHRRRPLLPRAFRRFEVGAMKVTKVAHHGAVNRDRSLLRFCALALLEQRSATQPNAFPLHRARHSAQSEEGEAGPSRHHVANATKSGGPN
jgi:hypothetical protein